MVTPVCPWRCGDATPDHQHFRILVREDGKLLGGLTPDGTANRLVIHQAFFSRDRADFIAADINAAGRFSATVVPA